MAATMTIKYFDTLEYVRKAKELRNTNAWAEYQANTIESALEAVVQQIENHQEIDNKENATKGDLVILNNDLTHRIELLSTNVDLKIEKLRYDMLKFIIWTGVGVVATLISVLGGLIGHGFHWF